MGQRKKRIAINRMKFRPVLIGLSALTGLILAACGKGTDAVDQHAIDLSDSTTPVVHITSPTTNQVYNNGDVMSIDGTVSDNSLYQGTIQIIDKASNTVVYQQQYEIHGYQSYDFHLKYQVSVFVLSHYSVKVSFEDHGLNEGSQSVRCNRQSLT